jgi:hypothetical protein
MSEVEMEERIESRDLENESLSQKDLGKDMGTDNKLFLGDEIKINANVPDSKIQNNIYEVIYIDLGLIQLNDVKTQQAIKIHIRNDELVDKIEDEDILEIQVLKRKPTHKYIEQHDFKIDMVLSIELSLTHDSKEKTEEEGKTEENDKPLVITCQIIDVDKNQDTIEVKVLLEELTNSTGSTDAAELTSSLSPEIKQQLKDSIFINFGCRGLPFWIKRIKVIEYKPKPSQIDSVPQEEDEGDVGIDLDLVDALEEGNHIFANIMYEVPSSQKIVSEVKQYNDLLENIISSVPKHKRTDAELNGIHKNIERFFQLRKEYSLFDKNGVPKMPPPLTDSDKPAIPHIEKLDAQLYWVLPVVENIKKLYVLADEDAMQPDTVNGIYDFKQQIMEEKGIYPDRNAPYNPNIMNDLNSYLTPFENPKKNPDTKYAIQDKPVRSNLLTLSANNDTVKKKKGPSDPANNDTVTTKKGPSDQIYIDRMYNTGLTKLEFEDVKSNSVKRVESTPNDPAFITSFITLNSQAVHLSQLLLPDTFLSDQVLLDSLFLKTWQSIISSVKMRDDIQSEIVGSSDINDQYALFKDAILFSPDISGSISNNSALLRKFISAFVPTNQDAFSTMEKENRFTNCLSLCEIIYALQPFFIYTKNVTVDQYETMRAFVHKNIDNYLKKLGTSKSKFKKLVNKNDLTAFESLELFYGAFNDHDSSSKKKSDKETLNKKIVLADDTTVTFDEIFKLYKFNELKRDNGAFLSSSEILKTLMDADCARLFMDALAVENSDLTSSEIDGIIRREEQDLKEQMSKDASSPDAKTCDKLEITLSKVYSSIALLEKDNGNKALLFDSRYDPTEKRVVKDGDYAALKKSESDDGYDYYVRRDNKWVKDELQNVDINDPSYFCNIPSETKPTPFCFSINQKCLDKSVAETSILQNLTSRIVSEFDQKSEQKKRNIDETFLYDLKNIKLLDKLKVFDILKYNKFKYALGQENKKRVETVVTSPYQDTVNCILSIDDVALKYQCILDMVNSELFVRNADPSENEHWYYCKLTGVRLLPTFLYELAQNYNPADPKSSKYMSTLSRIEKTNGKREGDQIVDKFSGYAISKIAFVSEGEWMAEGEQDEPFEAATQLMRDEQQMASDLTSVNSGEVIEISIRTEGVSTDTATANTAIATLLEEEEEEEEENVGSEKKEEEEEEETENEEYKNREEYETTMGIINHYENSLSIVLRPKDKRFIVETLQLLIPAKKTKEQYEADKKASADYETYEKTYNQYLIFYCMALLIIVVQTSVPQIKTKTTFPNCVKSFGGYPFSSDETDMAFIIYMACITQKVKSDYAPWNSVKKINQDKMRDTLFNLIKTKIINQPQIQARVEAKRDHDAAKQQRETVKLNARHKINDALFLFRPLLVNPSVVLTSTPLPVTKTYCDDLKRNLKNGNSLQTENILVLQSKIIHFSLLVQKLVQDVITAQTADRAKLLSKNYIQNACCNESKESTLQYMIKREPNIKNYCDMVECTADILHDVYGLGEAASMLDPKDTRSVIPELPSNFDEFTIYNAFMVYCNYGNNKGLKVATEAEPGSKKKRAKSSKKKAEEEGEGAAKEKEEEEQEEGQEGEQEEAVIGVKNTLSEEIHKICKFKNTLGENRDIFNILKSAKSMTHENKLKLITQIKNEFDLDYTIKDLQHLLQLVNRQSMKPLYEPRVGTYGENLNRILIKIAADLKKDKMLLSNDVLTALKTFNENQTPQHSRELQRQIEKNNKILTEQITEFLNIKNKGVLNAVFRTPSDITEGIVTKGGIMLFNRMENALLNGANNTLEVSVEFVKNAIKNITQVYPNIILSQISEIESLPPYITGQLSSGDAKSIMQISNERVTNTLGNFYKIGSKKPVHTILKNVQLTTLLLNEIVANTPIYSDDKKHITVLLYEYYFLAAVNAYIHFSNVVKQFREKKMEQKKLIDVQKEVSRILNTYFELVLDDKKIMNRNIDAIRENYLRSVDDERDDIVQNVDKMSEDQKQIYLFHKKYKMGSQSIGKNVGLRIYNPDFETEELARLERINSRKKDRGLSAVSNDPEAIAREYAVADEGDAPDFDPDEENEMQEDDAHEEYANSADLYPDSYVDAEEGVTEFES